MATVGGGRRCESGLMSCEAEEEAAEARVSASRTFMLRYTLIQMVFFCIFLMK